MVLADSAAPSAAATRFVISIMAMVLTQVHHSQNSASVLGLAERSKAAAARGQATDAGPPGFRMCGAEERRVASARPAWRRRAFVRVINPHAKGWRVVVIEENRFHRRHNSFRIVRLCFIPAHADAK